MVASNDYIIYTTIEEKGNFLYRRKMPNPHGFLLINSGTSINRIAKLPKKISFTALHFYTNTRNSIILLLLLFLCGNKLLGQVQTMRFRNFATEQGLSLNDVKNIFQDNQGFMWFGTRDGLNKFDGNKFIVYKNDPLDSASISSNDVKSICEDNKGYLWVATTGGLNRFDKNKATFKRYIANADSKNSLATNVLNFIFLNKDGNLIIGHKGGVIVFNPAQEIFSNYSFLNAEKKETQFTSFLLDNEDLLWMGGASEGLKCFDTKTKKITHFSNDPLSHSMHGYNIRALCKDKQGYLWIGTIGNGLFRYDPIHQNFIHYKHEAGNANSLCHDEVFSLREDNSGKLWIGTQYGGLSILDNKRENFLNLKKDINDPFGIADNTIQYIYTDRTGSVWLATFVGGINFYDANLNKFRHYKYSPNHNSISNNVIRKFVEDERGIIWIATEGGLNSFDPKTGIFKTYLHNPKDQNSLSSNVLINMCKDQNDNIWISTSREGLNLFNPKKETFKAYKNNPHDTTSLRSNAVFGMLIDRQNNFWVGVQGGLQLFDPSQQRFIFYPHPPSGGMDFSLIYFFSMFEDSHGIIWFKSDFGLHQFDKKTKRITYLPQNPNSKTSLSNNNIAGFFEDRKRNFWVLTENGLNLLDRSTNSFKRIGVNDGIPNAFFNGILEDDKGNFWLAHNMGLSCFNPNTHAIKTYDVADGLQHNEFRRNAYLKTNSGEMYFGGINGFNVFHPDSLKDNNFVPPVYIVDFQLFNKSVPIGGKGSPLQTHITASKEITLSHNQSVLSFEFVALNYIQPEENQYAYKLENFDEDWNLVGNDRKATYTNLDPGKYTFRVKAANNDGVWNNEGTSLTVIVKPPFWLTWWFKTLVALFLLSSFITFYKVRIGLINRQKKVLENQVKIRTEEISAQKDELIEKSKEIVMQNQQLVEQQKELEAQRNSLAERNKTIEEKNALLKDQQLHLEHIVEKRTQELTETNKELILAKQQLQDMMDNSPAVIYIKKPDGKYLFINRQYEKTFHVSRDKVNGMTAYDVFPPDVAKMISQNDQQVFEKGHSITFEETTPYEGGTRTYLAVRFPLHDAWGTLYAIGGISTDITDRKLAEEALRDLSAHLQEVREEERIVIAREIHDELGQQITGIKMDVSWISKKMPGVDGLIKQKIDGILKLLDEAVKTIRRISTELRPSILDDLGLIAAMEWQSHEFQMRSGIHTEFKSPMDEVSVPKNIATSLFRIYQESLTNVARHAEAHKISSQLQLNNNHLVLKITDNGKGFEVNKITTKKTLGLLGMKERTMMMGGKYEIISAPGKGTTVMVTVPL